MKNKIPFAALAMVAISSLIGCNANKQQEKPFEGSMSVEGYSLNQTVILSRHNIRAPLSGKGSLLDRITPNTWYQWSSNASELSLRGGVLETEMGQYFRKWFEKEKLFPENYQPQEGEVLVYANAKQRTIATSKYFSAGLMPSFVSTIQVNAAYDTMDPVFNPQLTFVSPSYVEAAKEEVNRLFKSSIEGLKDNFTLLADVLDYKNSEAYKNGEVGDFRVDDTVVNFEVNKEPSMTGSLKNGCTAADGLTLQYYEEADAIKAGFGHNLSFDQWRMISKIKDVYGDVLFTAPKVCVNVAHPLLEEIEDELTNEERKFTFLCGHDSNIGSVLASLQVEDYSLPRAIEWTTPIGCKLVFNSYSDKQGEDYYGINLVYQSVEQLRNVSMLDLDHPPMIVPLKFKGLTVNDEGLYKKGDFLGRLASSIAEYDNLVSAYSK